MREDVGKQCTHVHCYMAGGGGRYKEGLPGEMESYVGGGDEEGAEGCHGARRAEPRLRGAGGRRGGPERRKERGGQQIGRAHV